MILVKPSVEILSRHEIADYEDMKRIIEVAGRTCYKSEANIGDGSADKIIRNLIQRGHESVLEHGVISVKIITNRGVSHEIVRHRIASYSQESTRYCNYTKDKFQNQIQVIEPDWVSQSPNSSEALLWKSLMSAIDGTYNDMVLNGKTPDIARGVLPNDLKTELVMTANIREWRHFLKLRTSEAAHRDIRKIAKMILVEFKKFYPIFFEDIEYPILFEDIEVKND